MSSHLPYALSLAIACTLVTSFASAQPIPSPADGTLVERSSTGTISPPEPPHDEFAAQTLFTGKVDHGGYGAPSAKITRVNGDAAGLVGVQGGWIVNHAFVLGVAGYGLASTHEVPEGMQVEGRSSTLQLGYGGIRLGYLLLPRSLVHLGFGVLIGGGGLAALSRDELPALDDGDVEYKRRTEHSDAFFVAEPEVEGELSMTKFFRVVVSGSYRLVAGVDSPGLSNSRVGGPAAGLALRFGSF